MPGSFAPTITVVPSLAPTPRPNPFNSASSEWSEIWTTCQLNVFVFCVLVAIFWHQRLRDDVFQPRAKYRPERVPPECAAGLKALWRVFRIDDARLQRHVGLDAFVLIRFLRLWKRLAFAMSAFSAMVLVPVYMAEDGTRGQAGFDKFTMGNLKYGSPRLWAPFTFTWLLALFAAHLLETEGKLYTRLRHRFLTRGDDDDGPQPRCSVVVEHVPAKLRSDAALKRYFSHLMGDDAVHSAVVYLDCRGLEKTLEERDRAALALETLENRQKRGWRCRSRVYARPWTWSPEARSLGGERCGPWTRVDALEYQAMRLNRLNAKLAAGQKRGAFACASKLAASPLKPPASRASSADGAAPVNPLRREAGDDDMNFAQKLQAGLEDGLQVATDLVQTHVDAALDGAEEGFRDAGRAANNLARRAVETLALEDAFSKAYARSSTGVVTFASPGAASVASQLQLGNYRGCRAVRGVAPRVEIDRRAGAKLQKSPARSHRSRFG